MNVKDRSFTSSQRAAMAKSGEAMPDGSFPIANKSDLENAIHAVGRASSPGGAKAHIMKRAKALGATNMLPPDWTTGDAGDLPGHEFHGNQWGTAEELAANHALSELKKGGRNHDKTVAESARLHGASLKGTHELIRSKLDKTMGMSKSGYSAYRKNYSDSSSVQLFDTFTIDGVKRTSDGYLAAFAKVARTGIQVYQGSELGKPELDQVRVYRSPEEVFAPDAMHSFAHRPVTLRHPSTPVTAKNWKQFARGQTGDEVVRDGEFVRVPMVMMDQGIIDAYEKGGVKELSMGYSTDLKWTPGITTDGEPYDAVQTAIRANHLAVVPVARGGRDLRVGDDASTITCPECGTEMASDTKTCPECGHDMTSDMPTKDAGHSVRRRERTKPMKMITVDGITVEMEDQTASIVQRQLAKDAEQVSALTSQVTKLTTDAAASATTSKTALDEATKTIGTKDAEIATLKKQVEDAKLTPEKLDALVKDRSAVQDKAKAILGDKLVVDGKSVSDIRRQVVDAKMGDAAKGWNDDQIAASFNTLTHDVKGGGAGQLADALTHRPHYAANVDDAGKAYDEKMTRLNDAWKTPARAN